MIRHEKSIKEWQTSGGFGEEAVRALWGNNELTEPEDSGAKSWNSVTEAPTKN